MKIWVRSTVFSFAAIAAVTAMAQETRLNGIRLYDSGVDVVRKLGSPNEVLPINVAIDDMGAQSGGSGGGRSSGGRGGFAPPPGGGGMSNFVVPPLSLNQVGAPKGGGGRSGGGGGPMPISGGGGPAPLGGGGGGGSTSASNVTFVRWVYRRGAGGSINVVLNNHNKVVQIEAIGVSNGNVRTSKGVTLGSSMATVMKLYQTPDSYEIGSNYFMIRFLMKHRVAFRLTRENEKAPYRVTAIVVSAGK